ncbi:unnamed protein product [Didymodactylos carnosus]|uniref:UBR-type domain-containing protein n=1 Tax=Didymodactylos carnosus TaxID=1234261 RepID=A0A813UWT9_9BILA|nr:unnamed protein product [Didymodactylos carnosus]CAF3623448.1 unnamed protein product [Didymodactylos carnosus]
MSTDDTNPEQSKNDDCVTCDDLLEAIDNEEQELDQARALYGSCDVDSCTYAQGYVKRQALFVCMTCYRNNSQQQLAGICAACAYHCHSDHEINELYTRRYFRCDCGNSKFNDNQPCKLNPNKEAENTLNKYDDNFRGLYCTCKKPYPDSEIQDEMLQCVPLPTEVTDVEQLDFVCQTCITKHPFLSYYAELATNTTEPVTEDNSCLLEQTKKQDPTRADQLHAIFFRDGWRKRLCRCSQCSKMYENCNLSVVFDEEDSIQEYERQSFEKSDYLDPDKLLANSLQQLDHVTKMEVLYGINEFKESLGQFLRNKADGLVTTADIHTFFGDLQQKRKDRSINIPNKKCKY